jgi:hypothetical protein
MPERRAGNIVVDGLKEYFTAGNNFLKAVVQARKGLDKANASIIEWERVLSRRGGAIPKKLRKRIKKPRKNIVKSIKYYKKAQEEVEQILKEKESIKR